MRPCHLSSVIVAFSLLTSASASELHDAVLAGQANAVAALLEAGVNINEPGDLGTPLHMAAFLGNEELAVLLLDRRADIEAPFGAFGFHPLHTAASYGNTGIVDLLLRAGAEINVREAGGGTALTLAARGKKREMVKLLLDRGADASVRLPTRSSTVLHQAVAGGDVEIVKLLVNAGADIYSVNSNDETPLNYAARQGATDIIEFLVSRGADLHSRSRIGLTPLLEAEGGGHKQAADLLRRLGARE